jgi:hypothetical protein
MDQIMKTFKLHYSLVLIFTILFAGCSGSSDNNDIEIYTLNTTVTPLEAGTLSPSTGQFEVGEQVQISASANQNWIFKEWNGDLTGNNNPISFTVSKDMNINALFEKLIHSLTVSTSGNGTVAETVVTPKTDYEAGTMVELVATPDDEWEFERWSGDLESDDNPVIISMDEEKVINASFKFGFEEDFENDAANNWLFSDSRFTVGNGNLQFDSGGIGNDTWGGAYFNRHFTNFKIETRVVRLESIEGIENSMTIFIRSDGFMSYQSPVSGYQISITQDGFGSVWKIDEGTESNLLPWVPVEQLIPDLGNYNVVTVNVNGGRFDIFVNEEHIIGFSDDSFTGGYAGVATFAEDNGVHNVHWDYVNLLPADAPQKSQGKLTDKLFRLETGSSKRHTAKQ